MSNKNILVLYGGTNTEHEVSIVSAIQAMLALEQANYFVIPVYISKQGNWVKGDKTFYDPKLYIHPEKLLENFPSCCLIPSDIPTLQIDKNFGLKKRVHFDVAFPVFHGKNGEDGSIQGLLQLYNIPFVGCPMIGSSVGMDKHLAKRIAHSLGINTTKDIVITRSEWTTNKKEIITNALKLSKSAFIKPVKMGSSIGITKAKNKSELENAVDVAFFYDSKVIIEEALEDINEINISIIGNDPYETSITEMPAGSDEILSFQDKYLRSSGGKNKSTKQMGMASLQRRIPAPVARSIISQIEEYAKLFFRNIEGRGLSRIDFILTKTNQIYFNEINTIPGSLSFYLWEKTNLPFPRLVDKLVKLALEDHNTQQKTTTTFTSNILSHYNENAAKGAKTSS